MKRIVITKIVNGFICDTEYAYGISNVATFHPDMSALIKHMETCYLTGDKK